MLENIKVHFKILDELREQGLITQTFNNSLLFTSEGLINIAKKTGKPIKYTKRGENISKEMYPFEGEIKDDNITIYALFSLKEIEENNIEVDEKTTKIISLLNEIKELEETTNV